MRFTPLMVDLETLGTAPDAVVLSAGVFRFHPDEKPEELSKRAVSALTPEGECYGWEALVALEGQLEPPGAPEGTLVPRSIDGRTLAWWLREGGEQVQRQFFGQPRLSLVELAAKLLGFVDQHGITSLWSRGTDFDLPILRSLLGQAFAARLERLADHTHNRDVRSWVDSRMGSWPDALEDLRERTDALRRQLGGKHGALADAAAQAFSVAWCNHATSVIKGGGGGA